MLMWKGRISWLMVVNDISFILEERRLEISPVFLWLVSQPNNELNLLEG